MNEKTQMTTALSGLSLANFDATFEVEIRNSRKFQPDGKTEIYYSADAELATPGKRWATLRLKISSTTGPVPVGRHRIVVDSYDLKKGEGVGHVAEV